MTYVGRKQTFWIICLSLIINNVSAAPSITGNPLFFSNSKDFVTTLETGRTQSTLDEVHLMVFKQMDEVPDVQYMPASRIMQKLDEAPALCVFSRLKTKEREAYIFSQPVAAFLSPRLFQRVTNQPVSDVWLDQTGAVISMPELFNSGKNGTLLLLRNRSYGDFLDSQISRIQDEFLHYRWGADGGNKDVRMLLKDRADFILVYPANIYLEKSRFGGPALRSYAIKDAPEYALSYTMCNDRPASRAYLEKFNRGMDAVYGSEGYVNAHLNYVSDESKAPLRTAMAEAGLLGTDSVSPDNPKN